MIDNILDSVKILVNDKIILITGGTGTFGHEMTNILLNKYNPKKLIIYLE